MSNHEKIDYVEFPARDLEAVKKFYSAAFGWTFTDFGSDYTSFSGAGVDGGFFQTEATASTSTGSVLVVLHSKELEQTLAKVESAGGKVIKPTFSFPGGRRFHFTDPNGNELAVWSDKGE